MKHSSLLLVFFLICQFSLAQLAPDFTFTDTDGNVKSLYADYLNQDKIVVIKMFFIACPICKPYNEPFQNLYIEFGEGASDVEFLLLTTKDYDTNAEIAQYRTDYGLTFPGSGTDGGGYAATETYRNGTYGTYFGAPTFIVIEPNKTVHFDIGTSGVEATIQKIREKITEIQNGETSGTVTTFVNIDLHDYKAGNLPSFSLRLRSRIHPDSSYAVPKSFYYPSADYPALSEPEVYVEITEKSNVGVTTIDLVLIQRYILSILPLDNMQVLAADVNGSGTLTPSDLLSMRKVILSIQDEFAVGRSYLALDSRCNDDIERCLESVKIDNTLETQQIDFTVIKYGDMK